MKVKKQNTRAKTEKTEQKIKTEKRREISL
jgi:hypothetical protein